VELRSRGLRKRRPSSAEGALETHGEGGSKVDDDL
jgi:hypothetical protein